MNDLNGNWCVLRTAGASTLRLAETLAGAGFEAWTPSATVPYRRPRSKQTVNRVAPMLPTFVFARADRLADLIVLAAAATKAQPSFSVFRYYGQYPLISDRGLEPLRTAEQRAVPKELRRTYKKGDAVRVPDGPYAGMSGVVETTKGKFTLVLFPGSRITVSIAAFHLRPNSAEERSSAKDEPTRSAAERRLAPLRGVAALGPTERAR